MENNIIEYPITLCGNSPFIEVKRNGESLWFMIDSGCQGCVLDLSYVNIPLEELQEEYLTGVGNCSTKGYSFLLSVKLGNEYFYCSSTATELGCTFDKFKDKLGKVVGILGGEFLYNYKMVLDYSTSSLRTTKENIDTQNSLVIKA